MRKQKGYDIEYITYLGVIGGEKAIILRKIA